MTEIRHRMDLQTRKLVLLNNSRAGGVRGDDRSLVLRFDIPGLDLSEYTPYIVFDVRAYDGRRYVFSPTTTPAFDGKAFAVPYEVMRRVTGPLVYAVAIMGKTAGDDTFTQSQQAVLQVADSIREDGVQVELDPTLAATVARLETALGALEARVEAVEGTEACTGCVTAEQAAATAAGLAESARQAAVAASSAALGNAVQGLTDAYSDADEELLAAAKAYADAVAGAAAVPTDTVTSAQLAAGIAEINGTVSSNKAETDGRLDVAESDIEDLKNRPRYYTHNQSAISDRWQVAHNTGAYLQLVAVFDESGNQAGVGQVTYVDADSLVVSFNIAFAGTAVFIR